MKRAGYSQLFLTFLLILPIISAVNAQTENLTNADVIALTKVGVSKEIILQKLKTSAGNYDLSVNSLIELKKAGVDDEIVAWLMTNGATRRERISTETLPAQATNDSTPPENPANYSESQPRSVAYNPDKTLTPLLALKAAKTVGIRKSTLNPSRQSLEAQLLKQETWRKFGFNLTEQTDNADLIIDIGFVPLSLVSHRYTFRIYDNRSGIVIAAGVTTSWGDLATNLAKKITLKLGEVLLTEEKQK